VKLDEGYLTVHQTVDVEGESDSTKTETTRMVALERELVPLLRAMKRDPKRLAFALPDDKHMARGLRRWLSAAGLDTGDLKGTATRAALTWHDLRATGITWRAVRGDDPLKIMQAAGHDDFKTTQKYIRIADVLRDGFGEVFPALPRCLVSPDELPGVDAEKVATSGKQAADDGSGRWDLNPVRERVQTRLERENASTSSGMAAAKYPNHGSTGDSLAKLGELPKLIEGARMLGSAWDIIEGKLYLMGDS
jgi:hypothetical protein